MTISDILSPDCVMIDVRVADKAALLKGLASRLEHFQRKWNPDFRPKLRPEQGAGALSVFVKSENASAAYIDVDRIAAELFKREELGSTGTGGGVAIPHARLPEVKRTFGLLVRLQQAIEFDAIDGKPVDIVFALLLPATPEGQQLAALAGVARKLRDASLLRDIRRAHDATRLYSLMVQD